MNMNKNSVDKKIAEETAKVLNEEKVKKIQTIINNRFKTTEDQYDKLKGNISMYNNLINRMNRISHVVVDDKDKYYNKNMLDDLKNKRHMQGVLANHERNFLDNFQKKLLSTTKIASCNIMALREELTNEVIDYEIYSKNEKGNIIRMKLSHQEFLELLDINYTYAGHWNTKMSVLDKDFGGGNITVAFDKIQATYKKLYDEQDVNGHNKKVQEFVKDSKATGMEYNLWETIENNASYLTWKVWKEENKKKEEVIKKGYVEERIKDSEIAEIFSEMINRYENKILNLSKDNMEIEVIKFLSQWERLKGSKIKTLNRDQNENLQTKIASYSTSREAQWGDIYGSQFADENNKRVHTSSQVKFTQSNWVQAGFSPKTVYNEHHNLYISFKGKSEINISDVQQILSLNAAEKINTYLFDEARTSASENIFKYLKSLNETLKGLKISI